MPIAKFEMPDGRVARFEVPEGTTPEQAQQQAQDFIRQNPEPPVSKLPPDVPMDTPDGVSFSGDMPRQPKPEPTIGEKVIGAGETGLTALTGMTGGTLGTAKGFLQQLVTEMREGKFGTQEAADRIEKMAMQEAGKYTYAPRTETGREYTKNVGEVAQQLAPASGLGGELNIISQATKFAKPLGAQAGARAQKAAEAIKTGQKAKIPVMTSDVLPPKTFAGKLGQSITERIPFAGTGPVRAKQYSARQQAVMDLLSDQGAIDAGNVIDDVMKGLSTKRSEMLTKYSGMKNSVIKDAANRGTVPISKTMSAIDNEISRIKGLKSEQLQPAINMLEDYKQSFSGQNLQNIELLRKQLGESFKSPDLASVSTVTDKSVRNIYKAVRDDMGNFIKETGGNKDYNKWRVANARLAGMMDELNNTTLKSVLAKGEATPENVRRLLFSAKPSDLKTLHKNLNESGKNNAKVAILQEVVNKSGGIENLTTQKFMTNMNKMQNQIGVFFSNKDKQMIKGLLKTLDITKRSQEAGLKPPTGAEMTAFAAPTGISYFLGVDPVTGLLSTGGVGVLARAYESAPVRNMLIRIGQMKSKTGPQTQNMINQLISMPEYKSIIASQTSGIARDQEQK